MNIEELFHQFSSKTSQIVGSAWAFGVATLVVLTWAVSGPLFQFSEAWQLVINTGTTIVTFLMVFLIQNTQNRDAKVVHLKLDELIYSQQGARNRLIDLEAVSEEELKQLSLEFAELRRKDNSLHHSLDTVEKLLFEHNKQFEHQKKRKKERQPGKRTNH